jgi:hypothetical protein
MNHPRPSLHTDLRFGLQVNHPREADKLRHNSSMSIWPNNTFLDYDAAVEPSFASSSDCVRLDKDQGAPPSGPETSKQDPGKMIGFRESRPRAMSCQGQELLAQREIFQNEIPASPEGPTDCYEYELQRATHG